MLNLRHFKNNCINGCHQWGCQSIVAFLHLCVISCGGSAFEVISISFFSSWIWLVGTKRKVALRLWFKQHVKLKIECENHVTENKRLFSLNRESFCHFNSSWTKKGYRSRRTSLHLHFIHFYVKRSCILLRYFLQKDSQKQWFWGVAMKQTNARWYCFVAWQKRF